MIIIIPIFPITGQDYLYLRSQGLELRKQLKSISHFSSKHNHSLYFITNQKYLAESIRDYGNTVFIETQGNEPEYEKQYPPCTSFSLKWLREKSYINKNSELFIIDFRCTWISEKILESAYREFTESKQGVCIALRKIDDHPIQMNAHYEINDLDILYVSKKRPLENRKIPADISTDSDKIKISAFSIARNINEMPILIANSEDDNNQLVYLREALGEKPLKHKIYPFQSLTGAIEAPITINSPKDCKGSMGGVIVQGATYTGPIVTRHIPEHIDGYVVVTLTPANDKKADVLEPCECFPPLWDIDHFTHTRTERQSGRTVIGRQDFPLLHERDTGLLLSRYHDIDDIEDALAKGNTCAVFIDERQNIAL